MNVLDNIRLQTGDAVMEMKYIFVWILVEGNLKRVTTTSHGDNFVTMIQTFRGMDCGNENIIEEKEETNIATENLEIFKREFTSHIGVPCPFHFDLGDFMHSTVQGLIGIMNDNAESEDSKESVSEESDESGESEESEEYRESEESGESRNSQGESLESEEDVESKEPEDSEEIQRIINARRT